MRKTLSLYTRITLFLSVFLMCFLVMPVYASETIKIYSMSGDGLFRKNYDPTIGQGVDWESLVNEIYPMYVSSSITGSTGVGFFAARDNEGVWSRMSRAMYPFDTSKIPKNAEIISAKLHLFSFQKDNFKPFNNFSWNVYSAYPESVDGLVEEDYNRFGVVPFSFDLSFEETSDVGDNVFILNSEGKNFINRDGVSVFGIRDSYYDVVGNVPEWESYKRVQVKVCFSEYPDELMHPYLEIEYELPEKNTPLILIPGIMGSWEVDGEFVLDPLMNVYYDLFEALQVNGGYTINEDLFAFPYDLPSPLANHVDVIS